mmetsp:Transcript_22801/g.52876  ORF Transcript_22801/g.52876 Transcript_22801/m.52876 type:complete len:259 (+) Transcript_22801:4905-5681(+)
MTTSATVRLVDRAGPGRLLSLSNLVREIPPSLANLPRENPEGPLERSTAVAEEAEGVPGLSGLLPGLTPDPLLEFESVRKLKARANRCPGLASPIGLAPGPTDPGPTDLFPAMASDPPVDLPPPKFSEPRESLDVGLATGPTDTRAVALVPELRFDGAPEVCPDRQRRSAAPASMRSAGDRERDSSPASFPAFFVVAFAARFCDQGDLPGTGDRPPIFTPVNIEFELPPLETASVLARELRLRTRTPTTGLLPRLSVW